MSSTFYREDGDFAGNVPNTKFAGNHTLAKLVVRCGHGNCGGACWSDMAYVGARGEGAVLVYEYLCASCGKVRRFAPDPERGVRELEERVAPVGESK